MKEAELLAETVALLRIAGRVAQLGGWTIQLPGRELTWSDETRAIHDLPVGHQPTLDEGLAYFPEEYRAEVVQYVEACARDGTPYDFEVPKITATGRRIWVRSIGEAVRDGAGRIVGLQGAFQDITIRRHAEHALRQSEAQYRTLAAQLIGAQAVANIGSWETDLATLTTHWSAQTHRIFETVPEQFHPTHASFLQFVHPDDRSAVDDAFTRSPTDGSSRAIEHRLLMPDGRIKFVEERWQIVRDDQGQPVRAIGTCQDITERRRAQEAIRMQAHMLDQIGQAVIAIDTDGHVTYANRFAGDLYGWGPGEMLGRLITEVTVPQVSQKQGHEIMALLQRGETWTGEFLVQTRLGRMFLAQVTDSPVLDAAGRLVGIVGISTDITERRRAEDEARQKDTLSRMAGRLTHTGGWAVELPSEQVFWSDEVFDIVEIPRGSQPTLAEGLALYPDTCRDKIVSALEACARDGTPFDLETEILTRKGARKWVRLNAEAERAADGTIARVQGAFQDITARRHMEQQYLRAQRMESIGTLAGGIAHDLNNVLAPILLSIGLLQHDEHDPDRLEILTTIEGSARRGAAMVGRVLSFARGAEGRPELLEVPSLIRDLSTIVRDTFPKNITVEEHLDPDLWSLQADPTQLHQVLLNLCVNARDAMPEGGMLTLAAKNIRINDAYAALNIDARPGAYVILAVEDTGTGIPKEIVDRIFDPFFTTKDIGKGTGLGLATSLAIVTSHKGFMRVHSTMKTGTRFEVYLPAQTLPAKPAASTPALNHPRGEGQTVLVVDDEPAIRTIAKRMLETFGYRVLLAGDGAEAVALYAKQQADIDVVITDMMMPKMDGAATIQALVRLNPQVRIIGASGLATHVRAAGAAAACVVHFLSKPFTAVTLLTAMKAALAGTPGNNR